MALFNKCPGAAKKSKQMWHQAKIAYLNKNMKIETLFFFLIRRILDFMLTFQLTKNLFSHVKIKLKVTLSLGNFYFTCLSNAFLTLIIQK